MRIEPVDDARFLAEVARAGIGLAIEQTPAWDAVDAEIPGREPWGRLLVTADDGSPVALLRLTRYEGRGFTYLWGRHAPVWLLPPGERPSAELEASVNGAVRDHLRQAAPQDAFVRLHAWHGAPQLEPLLQTVTYDRTVRIDLTVPADAYLASLAKKFRYTVRQALGRAEVEVEDFSGLARADFDELYEVYRETAARDGFGIYPASVYWTMIERLRPHSRVFVARDAADGARPVIAWALFTVHDGLVQYVYAAGSARARETDATVRLLWEAAEAFRREGARTLDLMGIDSDLAPSLAGVGVFKRKWGEPVPVRPAWDLPLRPALYRGLRLALRIKRLLRR